MPERRFTPLQQAEIEVPHRRYEARNPKRWMYGYKVASIIGGIIDIPIIATHPRIIPTAIIGGTIYAASSAADRISTTRVFRHSQELRKRGIDSGVRELNPIFTDADQIENASPKQFNMHPKIIAQNVLGAIFSVSNLGVAIPLALGNLHASLNNFRLAKRYNRAVEIHDKQQAA